MKSGTILAASQDGRFRLSGHYQNLSMKNNLIDQYASIKLSINYQQLIN